MHGEGLTVPQESRIGPSIGLNRLMREDVKARS